MVPTLFAALLFLLGCKSDSVKAGPAASSPASGNTRAANVAPVAPATPPAPDSAPVIVCFGDSITAGYGLDRDDSYPADMQRDLDKAGFHYRVVNMGVSGETTKDALLRVQHVLDRKPEVVVVEFGGNDGLRGVPIPEAQRNLAAIVSALKRGGTRVLLAGITLPPQYGAEYVSQFNSMYQAVARQANVPLLPFIYKDVYNIPGDLQEDGVHPTIEGAKQVALNIEEMLTPMLHK